MFKNLSLSCCHCWHYSRAFAPSAQDPVPKPLTTTAAAAASVVCAQTAFEANSALSGGAIAATGQGFSAVYVHGSTRFTGNIATELGGAVYLQRQKVGDEDFFETTMNVGGTLCAQGNAAPTGALAALDGEVKLNFYDMEASAQTSNQGGTDSDIAMKGSNAETKCTYNGATWPRTDSGFRDYTVVGDVCACNDAFVSGASTTCGGCGATGWDTNTCSCRVSEVRAHTVRLHADLALYCVHWSALALTSIQACLLPVHMCIVTYIPKRITSALPADWLPPPLCAA